MQMARMRLFLTGEITAWGKQFLSELEQRSLAEIVYEPKLEKICQLRPLNGAVPVVAIENLPESRRAILQIRQSGKPILLLWFGRNFAKEDLAFAVEHRVYSVFENSRADDAAVSQKLSSAASALESVSHFDHLIRAVKGVLLQSEEEGSDRPLVQELKAAVSKLEKVGHRNEFLGLAVATQSGGEDHLPFHQAQTFGDALETVYELERTGTLRVRGKDAGLDGRIDFLKGKIMAATAAEVQGVKAIYRMFLWDTPRFLFARGDASASAESVPIPYSVREICQLGRQMRDRFDLIRSELPPQQIRLALAVTSIHPATAITPTQFSTLSSIVEFGKVADVLDYNPLPDVDILECLIQLRRQKLITVA